MRVTWKKVVLGLLPAAVLLWNFHMHITGAYSSNSPRKPASRDATDDTEPGKINGDVPDAQNLPEQGRYPPNSQQGKMGTSSGERRPPADGEEETEKKEEEREAVTRGPGIVQLFFLGRLGNNLFEYAAARALADRLGWALSIQPMPANKQKFGLLTRPEGMACFPGVRPVGPPPSSPEMASLGTVQFRGMKEELEDRTPRSIKMQDWYQDYSLFSSEKERFREIMALSPSCCGPTAPGPNDLVIHHRNYRAELTPEQYKRLIFKDLQHEFYEAVLRDAAGSASGRPETVWVVGEFNSDEPMFQRLQQAHGNVKMAEMVEDQFHAFCFLTRAPRLVMAHSTFSWWVAFLGNATEIHFPLTKQNRGVTGPSVAVDEARYIYRDDVGRVVPPP